VSYYLDIADGIYTYESYLYRDGTLVESYGDALDMYTGWWEQSWQGATSAGNYFLEIYVDGTLVGTSSVTVSGLVVDIWVLQSTYQIDDPITVCYTVSADASFSLVYRLPDDSIGLIADGFAMADEVLCFDSTVLPPRGQHCWEIGAADLSSSAFAEACFTVNG
jgi:hypothetical protein